MKKLVVLMLCGAMAIGVLAGCGGKKESTTFEWPTTELAQEIPKANSNVGEIFSSSDSLLIIHIEDASIDDYNEYVKQCQDSGYTIDQYQGTTTYIAKNENGNSLTVTYNESEKQISIQTSKKSEDTNSTDANQTQQQEQNNTSENPQTQASSDGIRPEVKEFLDSYESFMNEYAAFMKKYQNSNDTVSMMKDYADYMAKYADFTQKYNALDQSDFNDAETAYYIDVQARVTKVLAGVAQ